MTTDKTQYSRSVITRGTDPEKVLILHTQKLGNYRKHGQFIDDYQKGNMTTAGRALPEKPRNIEIMNTFEVIHNHDFIISTILCCEDEYADEY